MRKIDQQNSKHRAMLRTRQNHRVRRSRFLRKNAARIFEAYDSVMALRSHGFTPLAALAAI